MQEWILWHRMRNIKVLAVQKEVKKENIFNTVCITVVYFSLCKRNLLRCFLTRKRQRKLIHWSQLILQNLQCWSKLFQAKIWKRGELLKWWWECLGKVVWKSNDSQIDVKWNASRVEWALSIVRLTGPGSLAWSGRWLRSRLFNLFGLGSGSCLLVGTRTKRNFNSSPGLESVETVGFFDILVEVSNESGGGECGT